MLCIISLNIARLIASNKIDLEYFAKHAQLNEYIYFAHQNFYYSFPEWQKNWVNTDAITCYHKIEICCNCCKKKPSRNNGGYGNIYMYKSFRSTEPSRQH